MFWFEFELSENRLTVADAVLCRNTKPLVELAYALLRREIACHVEGREIGSGLIALTKKWARVKSCSLLRTRLQEWLEKQVAKLTAKGKETAAGELTDRVETLFVIMAGCDTVDQLRAKIERLFSDTPDGKPSPNLTLSTIHKSKGREWDRVYIYGMETYQPSKYARRDWEIEQEDNLCYVAVTRAKAELVYVAAPPPNAQ